MKSWEQEKYATVLHFRTRQKYVATLVALNDPKFFVSAGWALFLSKDVGHDLKPINNLLIISFPSLSQIALNASKILV